MAKQDQYVEYFNGRRFTIVDGQRCFAAEEEPAAEPDAEDDEPDTATKRTRKIKRKT